MNNFQNSASVNLFLLQPKIEDKSDRTPSDLLDPDKKKRKENKARKKFERGALKILFESEKVNLNENHLKWDAPQTPKKKNVGVSSKKQDQTRTEDQTKTLKEDKKKKKLEKIKTKYKKPTWISFLESEKYQVPKVSPPSIRNPEIWNFKQILRSHGSKAAFPKAITPYDVFSGHKKWKNSGIVYQKNRIQEKGNVAEKDDVSADKNSEKHSINFTERASKASFISQNTVRRNKSGRKSGERTPKAEKGSPCTLSVWSQKSAQGLGKTSQHSEVKSWDSRKIQINEILKGHAQKVQGSTTKSCQNMKDLQGVSELLMKAKGIFPGTFVFEKKEKKLDGEEECLEKKDEEKSKFSEKLKEKEEEEEEKEEEEEEGDNDDDDDDDDDDEDENEKTNEQDAEESKKKMDKWLIYPQTMELEKKLNGVWLEQENPFHQSRVELDDEKISKKSEEKLNKVKNEKKEEKRMTYTDRLILSKMMGERTEPSRKNSESFKVGNEDSEIKSCKDELECRKQFLAKKPEIPINRPSDPKAATLSLLQVTHLKEVNLSDGKELVAVKDGKSIDADPLKARSGKSNELRELVTQAVREHKIFCIFDNHWYIVRPVREELLNRGWLEVIPDRRLIPKRRPPPSGPTYDREKNNAVERNYGTIEAILTAKEMFAAEIQETVRKCSSLRISIEKPKSYSFASTHLSKKSSFDSLSEIHSQFRIIPPSSEKKKNNVEIREFVTKYQSFLDKEREKEVEKQEKDKERAMKLPKEKDIALAKQKKKFEKNGEADGSISLLAPFSQSLQEIINSVYDNKKIILETTADIEALGIGMPKTSTSLLAIEPKKKEGGTSFSRSSGSKTQFTESEAKVVSKIIQSTNSRIHFMWLSIKPAIHLKCFNYSPEIVNKFQRTTFCTKIGLWSHLSNIQWYAHEVHFPAKSPRMYNTGESDDLQAFFQDFQLTACLGMLKWLSDTFFERGMKAVHTRKGKVPLKAFEFAIKQCEKYMRFKENEDLGVLEEARVHQDEWNTFLQWFYTITNDHGKIQESSSAQLMVVYTKAVETLRTMKRHWPEIDIDGRLNIWIMKPYCASCGRGIFMTNNVHYISQHSKYIVQKYIEKPLLIYNTKFDIRQWFMITKLTPLEIWMYKECYLRFCTQPFALRNLHESVHLSNNSVQRKYVSNRDPSLPDQNMWDSTTFQLYLKTIGYPNTWQEIIYPGMKDAIVSTMLAAQDTFDGPRKNWFEIYGADFMLSANLKDGPWLIEINENPAMDPSTKVTARLCPQMLRDVIKVVVDKRTNKLACTGQWELVYRQNYSPSYGTVDLDVRGKKIAKVPHSVKTGVGHFQSLNQQTTLTPTVKRPGYEEAEPNKLYEVVKSFNNNGQNSRGDAHESFSGKLEGREKSSRASRTFEKNSQKQIAQPSTLDAILVTKLSKEREKKILDVEDKQKFQPSSPKRGEREGIKSEHGRVKNSDKEKVKNIINFDEESKPKSPRRKASKSGKSSLTTISSTGRLRQKRSRNYSLSRESPKKPSLSNSGTTESDERKSAEHRSLERKNRTPQNQTTYQMETYNFTKFYKL